MITRRPAMVVTLIVAAALTILGKAALAADTSQDPFKQDRETSLRVLHQALSNGTGSVKVHAAEMLLFNNYYSAGVRKTFEAELAKDLSPAYRVGIWRVLVRAAGNDLKTRKQYLDKIVAAYEKGDKAEKERAAEALCMLGHSTDVGPEGTGTLQAYQRWIAANAGEAEKEAALADLLRSESADARAITARGLRSLEKIGEETFAALARAVSKEPADSPARPFLLSALYVHATTPKRASSRTSAGAELLEYLKTGGDKAKCEACSALAARGAIADIPSIRPLLSDPGEDVRVHAANALLRIPRRRFRGLGRLDWAVIGLYGVFMLGIGWHCSRRQSTTEEYFLGSRRLNPTLIGISMLATLLSTIGYLGNPGEMIKHGPMIAMTNLTLPFAYVTVGYLLIPHIMKSNITSAYELLERRLGLPGRMVGAIIFILARLVWMALLIYIAAKLMVAMLNWGPEMIPWVVVAAGIVTIVYTAMGGLRAVVITDVVQFALLMGGALLTILLVTVQMRGFRWLPTEWAAHWDRQPLFSWNLSTRVTVTGSIIASWLWWICVAGSDQVAIQRYLATRDVKAARHSFLINCLANLSVALVLYAVGFALLGFFTTNPHLIPDGKSLIADADYLFPRYIANYLPVGLAGLVVAAMFAAGMSSLDSGVNSIVTVIHKDFIGRLLRRDPGRKDPALTQNGKKKKSGEQVRLAKSLVFAIGIAVVAMSSQIGKVPGNIVEVTNKTGSLFTGPLFGLFFMALFVRRATGFGAIVGAVYGFMTGFVFAFWDKITGAAQSLSFQWIILASLVVQIPVSLLLSRIPTRGKGVGYALIRGVVSLIPLAILYGCLLKWGIHVARFMQWGVAGG